MKIALSGSTGLVGTALRQSLETDGHAVVPIVRRADLDGIVCDVQSGTLDAEKLEGLDAVVHLAGHNVAAGRWNTEQKRLILESRSIPTRLMAEAISKCAVPPPLISASGIGIYGDRGDEALDEASSHGDDFLADVCKAWESACEPARTAGARVVNLRLGVVLSRAGGALAKMLTPFRLGLGGPVGSGCQYMAWISLADVVGAIRFAIENQSLHGPVNLVGPEPVRQKDFAKALGKALGRPAFMPMPAFAIRMLLGREMADALLMCSAKAMPKVLQDSGFAYQHPKLDQALAAALKK